MIKRFLLLSFVFLIAATGINAQKRIFHGGLNFGITATQVHNDNSGGFNKIGLYFGGFILTHFSDQWMFEIGMNYAGKGARENSGDKNVGYNKYVSRLGYIEFPFLIKFRLKKFEVEAGLSIGFLLFGKEYFNGDLQKSPTKYKRYEFAGILGASYMFNDQWGLEIRSQTSLLPIRTPTEGVFYTNGQGQYNIVISFTVRYFIW
jgi:hypothetical protein